MKVNQNYQDFSRLYLNNIFKVTFYVCYFWCLVGYHFQMIHFYPLFLPFHSLLVLDYKKTLKRKYLVLFESILKETRKIIIKLYKKNGNLTLRGNHTLPNQPKITYQKLLWKYEETHLYLFDLIPNIYQIPSISFGLSLRFFFFS